MENKYFWLLCILMHLNVLSRYLLYVFSLSILTCIIDTHQVFSKRTSLSLLSYVELVLNYFIPVLKWFLLNIQIVQREFCLGKQKSKITILFVYFGYRIKQWLCNLNCFFNINRKCIYRNVKSAFSCFFSIQQISVTDLRIT